MKPKVAGDDHHRADGEAVEPVGDVDGVAGADDHEGREGEIEPAEVEQDLLGEGQRQAVREARRRDLRDHDAGGDRDRGLERERATFPKSPCATASSP